MADKDKATSNTGEGLRQQAESRARNRDIDGICAGASRLRTLVERVNKAQKSPRTRGELLKARSIPLQWRDRANG